MMNRLLVRLDLQVRLKERPNDFCDSCFGFFASASSLHYFVLMYIASVYDMSLCTILSLSSSFLYDELPKDKYNLFLSLNTQ